MDLDIQCEELSRSKWQQLVPTLKQYKTIRLDDCTLSVSNCEDLGSVLGTNQLLTELRLSNNELGDSGVELLCKGVMKPSCNLQKLWYWLLSLNLADGNQEVMVFQHRQVCLELKNCNLTKACCESLSAVLRSKPSLTELHLGDNNLGTSGVQILCQGLLDPNCQLQKLCLDYCELSSKNSEALSTALCSKASLTELNMSNNQLGDAAVRHLCQGLLSVNCKLQTLQLENCNITVASCKDLSTVLSTKPSLTELCIGENEIGDAGVALLCQGLLNPNCKIRKLWLWECDLSAVGCKDLSSVISTKETLQEMSLIGNNLKDEGMEFLCEGLKNPNARVQSLWLRECGLTAACCKSIGSVLSTNSVLKELHVGQNTLEDVGVAQICEGLMSPSCNLQSLWLGMSELTPACCDTIATVITMKQCLKELDLSYNPLGDEGVRKLCEAVRNPNCHLDYLILYDILWSSDVDDELKALEESKPGFKVVT